MSEEPVTTHDAPASSRGRHILVDALLVLGLLCILISTISIWLRDSVLDSGIWADQSGELLQSPNVRATVSGYVADQLVRQAAEDDALANALPPNARPLAAPALVALERLATEGVDRALVSPRVQELWVDANQRTHEQLIDFLTGHTERLQATDGQVQLNLNEMLADLAAGMGASPDMVARAQAISPIVVVRSKQLKTAQQAAHLLEVLSIWPFAIGVALIGLAIGIARDRRRQALRFTFAGAILASLLILAIRRIAGDALVDSVVRVDAVKPAAHDAWDIYTGLLVDSAAAGLVFGTLGLVGLALTSQAARARALRLRVGPTMAEHPLLPHLVLAGLLLLFLIDGPTGTPRRISGSIILAATAFAGLEYWRRQAATESAPADAARAPVAAEPTAP